MFNAEKILKGLVKSGLKYGLGSSKKGYHKKYRSSGGGGSSFGGSLLGGTSKAALGMGVLGVAIAAYEHFSKQQTPQAAGSSPVPPPPPPPPTTFSHHSTLGEAPSEGTAELLVKAMVAAANCDGVIDEAERRTILARVSEDGLTPDEQRFLIELFNAPPSIESILSGVASPELAEQVYGASLIAMSVDSDVERQYLKRLAALLRLSEEQVERWNSVVGFNLSEE